ncbi:MAG: hypothetical protein EXR50_01565 [Dehalococcoidia bacterium]|nr:hypothetical protein [Dehalococcoidia bacterium]
MQRWAYRRLIAWLGDGMGDIIGQDERGPFWDIAKSTDQTRFMMEAKWFYGGSKPTRLPLNPGRDWESVRKGEQLAWNDDAEWADVAMSVIEELGQQGWELVDFIYGHIYIFKRPLEE